MDRIGALLCIAALAFASPREGASDVSTHEMYVHGSFGAPRVAQPATVTLTLTAENAEGESDDGVNFAIAIPGTNSDGSYDGKRFAEDLAGRINAGTKVHGYSASPNNGTLSAVHSGHRITSVQFDNTGRQAVRLSLMKHATTALEAQSVHTWFLVADGAPNGKAVDASQGSYFEVSTDRGVARVDAPDSSWSLRSWGERLTQDLKALDIAASNPCPGVIQIVVDEARDGAFGWDSNDQYSHVHSVGTFLEAPLAAIPLPLEGKSTAWIRIVGAPSGRQFDPVDSTLQGFVTLGTERYQTTIPTTADMSLTTLTRTLVRDLTQNDVDATAITSGVIHIALDDELDEGVIIQVSDEGLTRGVSLE